MEINSSKRARIYFRLFRRFRAFSKGCARRKEKNFRPLTSRLELLAKWPKRAPLPFFFAPSRVACGEAGFAVRRSGGAVGHRASHPTYDNSDGFCFTQEFVTQNVNSLGQTGQFPEPRFPSAPGRCRARATRVCAHRRREGNAACGAGSHDGNAPSAIGKTADTHPCMSRLQRPAATPAGPDVSTPWLGN